MKNHQKGWLLAFTLSALVALNNQALAQEKKEDKPAHKPASGEQAPPRIPQIDRLARMKEQLKLTDEQIEKLRPIIKEEATKLRALREDTSLQPKDRQAKVKEIRDTFAPKINAILTAEQKETWEKMRQQGNAGGQRPQRPRGIRPDTKPDSK